jgi:hypothetical protein
MTMLKVLMPALAMGFLFVIIGLVLIEKIEGGVGRGSPIVLLALGAAGMVVGSIAGAAQAIVDAIEKGRVSVNREEIPD